MKREGKFIVVDGGEGAGKTTMIECLPEILPAGSFVLTHEPGGTPFAEKIRELILSDSAKTASAETQFSLFWAARAEHLREKIEPALAAGKNVICDRFDSSTYAYQVFGEERGRLEKLFWETREIFLGAAQPSTYLFLDVLPEEGLRRAAERRGGKRTHFEERSLDFHRRVREGFLEFLKRVPHKIIDANRSKEMVRMDVLDIVKKILTY